MRVSARREDVPKWVSDNWLTICPHCGAYIVDNSDTGVTTSRYCINPRCPKHMSFKAKDLADFFGLKGYGPATLYNSIQLHKYQSHFDFIPVWFKDTKPVVSLPEIAVMACIEGYGAPSANKELSAYTSFEQYFNQCSNVNPLLLKNKDLLIDAQKYFVIKPPMSARKIYVMGTGSFHGYSSRDEYFRKINDTYGAYINVIQTGKRKTGISYLLKEKDAVDHSKSQIAKDSGIPIVTPSEFIDILCSLIVYYQNMDQEIKQ